MKRRDTNLVFLMFILVVFLTVLGFWFSFTKIKTTGFALLVPEDVKFNGTLYKGPSFYSLINLHKGNIISNNFELGIALNSSRFKSVNVYLSSSSGLHFLKRLNVSAKRRFYDVAVNVSKLKNRLCGYRIIFGMRFNNKTQFTFTEPFSLIKLPGLRERGESVKKMFVKQHSTLILDILDNYLPLLDNKVYIKDKTAFVNDSLFCAIRFPVRISFWNITFRKPEFILNGKTCKGMCRIESYKDKVLNVSLWKPGKLEVREGFKFSIKLSTPSLKMREYKTNQKIPFYAYIYDIKDNIISGNGFKCTALFDINGKNLLRAMKYNNGRFEIFHAFNTSGFFPWFVNCVNLSSGYSVSEEGRFQVR